MAHGSGLDVEVKAIARSKRFLKEYGKLDPVIQSRANTSLEKLLMNPRPPGINFEQLTGYSDPLIFTLKVDSNFRISLEMIEETTAWLRRVAKHDDIYRSP
jgi:hypothetical protein